MPPHHDVREYSTGRVLPRQEKVGCEGLTDKYINEQQMDLEPARPSRYGVSIDLPKWRAAL